MNKGRVHFVVVFNLTRFAPDKYDHSALRSHLQSLGISLRSAREPIDDTSTAKLMEGVLAAFAVLRFALRKRAEMREARRLRSIDERLERLEELLERSASRRLRARSRGR